MTLAVPRSPSGAVPRWSTLLALFGAVGVLGALLAAPHGAAISQTFDLGSLPTAARAFQVTARAADVEIVVIDAPEATAGAPATALRGAATPVTVMGELHGFGLPTSVLTSGFQFEPAAAVLDYRIEQRGWFTDLSGAVTIRLPLAEFHRIVVNLGRGDIKVIDLTRSGAVRRGQVQLVLATKMGYVQH